MKIYYFDENTKDFVRSMDPEAWAKVAHAVDRLEEFTRLNDSKP